MPSSTCKPSPVLEKSFARKRAVAWFWWLIPGVALCWFPGIAEADDDGEVCQLETWEDGDTAMVHCGPMDDTVVRVLGIDTPESGFDANSIRRAQWQEEIWSLTYNEIIACGRHATLRAKALCADGEDVTLHGEEVDPYGRRLATIHCNGRDIGQTLVDEGLAGTYDFPDPPAEPTGCRALGEMPDPAAETPEDEMPASPEPTDSANPDSANPDSANPDSANPTDETTTP